MSAGSGRARCRAGGHKVEAIVLPFGSCLRRSGPTSTAPRCPRTPCRPRYHSPRCQRLRTSDKPLNVSGPSCLRILLPTRENWTPEHPRTSHSGSASRGRFGGGRSVWRRLRRGWQRSAPSGRAPCPWPGTERSMSSAGCVRDDAWPAASRVRGRPGALDTGPRDSVANIWRRTARIRHAIGHRGDRASPEGRRVARPAKRPM
jgi:hypothetical protein